MSASEAAGVVLHVSFYTPLLPLYAIPATSVHSKLPHGLVKPSGPVATAAARGRIDVSSTRERCFRDR